MMKIMMWMKIKVKGMIMRSILREAVPKANRRTETNVYSQL